MVEEYLSFLTYGSQAHMTLAYTSGPERKSLTHFHLFFAGKNKDGKKGTNASSFLKTIRKSELVEMEKKMEEEPVC